LAIFLPCLSCDRALQRQDLPSPILRPMRAPLPDFFRRGRLSLRMKLRDVPSEVLPRGTLLHFAFRFCHSPPPPPPPPPFLFSASFQLACSLAEICFLDDLPCWNGGRLSVDLTGLFSPRRIVRFVRFQSVRIVPRSSRLCQEVDIRQLVD